MSVRSSLFATAFLGTATMGWAGSPPPAEVFQKSVFLPAAGSWSIDQPMLATIQLGIDALAVAAIFSEAAHPIHDAGAGIATAAGAALLLTNRLLGAPLNAGIAHLYPPGAADWTSRQEPWLSISLAGTSTSNGWIGLETGMSGYRLAADLGLAMDGSSTFMEQTDFRLARVIAEKGWAAHPRLRVSCGVQAIGSNGSRRRLDQSANGNASGDLPMITQEEGYLGTSVGPVLSLETSQIRWLSLQARLSAPAWSSDPTAGEAWDPRFDFGLKMRLPSNR